MTSSLFYQTGARLRLPSGTSAEFVRWQARYIERDNRDAGMERIAVLRISGDPGLSEFSERFLQRCQVLS